MQMSGHVTNNMSQLSNSLSADGKRQLEHTEKNLKNKFYHCEEKGCKLYVKKQLRQTGIEVFAVNGFYCETHDCDVCRCMWEPGYHFGTDSKSFSRRSYEHLKGRPQTTYTGFSTEHPVHGGEEADTQSLHFKKTQPQP